MTLVVAGVTGATLYVVQDRVEATYQHLFEEQFQIQIKFFSETRLRQLDEVAKKCQSMASSVRLVSALEEGDADLIYDNVSTELREYYKQADQTKPPTPKGRPLDLARQRGVLFPAAGKPQAIPYVRVLDARGEIIEPTKAFTAVLKNRPGYEKRNEQMKLFADLARTKTLIEQEIGYSALKPDGALYEFIVTPVINPGTKETLGALLMGFPVQNFGEKAMYDFSENILLSGIWLEGVLYSQTIPQNVRKDISGWVWDEIRFPVERPTRSFCHVDGVLHRLFLKVLNPDSIFPPAAHVYLYSMASPFSEIRDLRQKILGVSLVALLAGVGVILFISHGFSKPIELLARATKQIQDGDFNVHLPVGSRDELGALAASFNHMADGLGQRDRYKSLLAQVTDKEVAEELMSGRLSLGGELRHVSVLFCDIRGFTALTENMPPAEVITMLNEHMTMMNRIVHEHYGVVDKFVGDLIMAVFGAPKSYGNDALHAARCAQSMVEERRLMNEHSHYKIEMGIGIATGEVVVGCMGSVDRLNYTVLGERVNLASRLCSKAGCMEVLVDETTCAALPEKSEMKATDPLMLKGFSTLMPAYSLLGIGPVIEADAEIVPS